MDDDTTTHHKHILPYSEHLFSKQIILYRMAITRDTLEDRSHY